MAIQRIKVNLIPTGATPVCYASQYDVGRKIALDVFNGIQPYIFTDEQLELDIRKSDGTLVTLDVPITVKSNTVEFITTQQMCACAGANTCELRVYKDGSDVGTANFSMQIERSPSEGGLKSESEINNLTTQMQRILDPMLEEEVPALVTNILADNGAEQTGYDNTESGLEATNVQDAIDELANKPSVDAYTKQESDSFLADEYDATQTYAVGDYRIHEGGLYVCNTPITTPETWDASHWTLTDVGTALATKADATATEEALGQLVEAVNGKADESEVTDLNSTLNKFPSDVLWNDNVLAGKLKRTFNGITTDFDVASLKPEQGKTYYIRPNGSDSNSGEDRDHPLQKLSTAIAKSDVQTIVVMDGIYNNGRIGGSFTKGVNIVADTDAHPIFIMSRDKTWSATAGYTKVYQTTDSASAFYGVVKADVRTAEGDLLYFTKVDTLAEVETTDNSYYTSEHDIYINSASAPSKVYVLVSGVNCHATLSNGETIYVEGIEFIGGNYGGFRITNGNASKKPLAIFKNCGFARSYLGNALYLQGCSGILQNCYASYSAEDGFNYHATLNVAPDTVEINCIGRHNGTTGNNTNNGSTTHDGAKILRLNCEFYDNIGPNLADVNNSLSFNYGVVSHDSAGASTNKTGFQCQGGSMYNDTCSAYNNDYNFQAYLGGTLYQHNCSGSVDTGADGKAKAY